MFILTIMKKLFILSMYVICNIYDSGVNDFQGDAQYSRQ